MKEVSIYIEGKYEYKFKLLTCIYYLSYKNCVIKKTEQLVQEGSHNRAQLQSLYFAIQRISEPCIINIYSKFPLGFKNPKKCNNKDLISEIQNLINKSGHIVKFYIDRELYQIKIWEQTYGTKPPEHINKNYNAIDINNKTNINDVFEINESNILDKDIELKRELDELRNESSIWIPGSGGY